MLAKQGAASSFLHKLAERQKRFKRFKASVSPSTLVDRRVIDSLYGKLREKYKRDRVPIEMHPDKQTYNNRVVYLWNVRIGLEIFQGLSITERWKMRKLLFCQLTRFHAWKLIIIIFLQGWAIEAGWWRRSMPPKRFMRRCFRSQFPWWKYFWTTIVLMNLCTKYTNQKRSTIIKCEYLVPGR